MGSHYVIDDNYPDENHTIRLTPDGALFNHRYRDYQLEMIEFLDDALRAKWGLTPVTDRRIYSNKPYGPDWEQESGGSGDVWSIEYTPQDALDSLKGKYCRVVDQYQQVVKNLDKTHMGGNPNEVGILQRLMGANAEINNTLLLQTGTCMQDSIPRSLSQLKTDLTFLYDEYLNLLRIKTTILTLHADRVRIWNILGCIWPLAIGENNNTLGPENLLCECQIRNQNDVVLTGLTACGRQASNDGFYVAAGNDIYKVNQYGEAVTHTGTTYTLTPTVGSGNITAIEYMGSRIWFIRGGLVYSMTTAGGTQQEVEFYAINFETNPPTHTKITGFDDLLGGVHRGVKKGTEFYYLAAGEGDTQANYYDMALSPTRNEWNTSELGLDGKIINLLPSHGWLVPLRRYFVPSGTPFNTNTRNWNVLVAASAGAGRVYGTHYLMDTLTLTNDPGYGLTLSTLGAYTRITVPQVYLNNSASSGIVERRAILRINCEQLANENLPGKLLHLSCQCFADVDESLWSYTGQDRVVNVHVWTQGGDHWPPVAGATDFGAVGTLLGTLTYPASHALNGVAPVSLRVSKQVENISPNHIASDGYLYLIFVQTNSQANTTSGAGNLGTITHVAMTIRGSAP